MTLTEYHLCMPTIAIPPWWYYGSETVMYPPRHHAYTVDRPDAPLPQIQDNILVGWSNGSQNMNICKLAYNSNILRWSRLERVLKPPTQCSLLISWPHIGGRPSRTHDLLPNYWEMAGKLCIASKSQFQPNWKKVSLSLREVCIEGGK